MVMQRYRWVGVRWRGEGQVRRMRLARVHALVMGMWQKDFLLWSIQALLLVRRIEQRRIHKGWVDQRRPG